MAANPEHVSDRLATLLRGHTIEELRERLAPRFDEPAARVTPGSRITPDAVDRRWEALPADPSVRDQLLDPHTRGQMEAYEKNIESFLGTVKVPVGVAGPLRVNGLFAKGDYYLPLATTEAALVASYNRGAQLISEAGGCTTLLLNEGVSRAPGFAFRSLADSGQFVVWVLSQVEAFRRIAESTTRYGKLVDVRMTVEGNHVYLNFEFTTGDASGQNMVTLATEAICDYISASTPVTPEYFFVEANLSGDKKASAQSFLSVRGKKATAEVTLPAELVAERLHTTSERMTDYWRMSAMGGVLSGTMGVQGHFANGLAAIYLACGQDVACVSESAVGITRFELTSDGALYATVTLPNIMVGTVGGGTGLPSQRASLELMGLAGPDKAQAMAEVCAGLCLAGELSIIGALCSGDFSRAHKVFARRTGRLRPKGPTGG